MDYRKFITYESGKRGGKPCIRGLRMTVYDVLDYLASGMTPEQIVADFDYLTPKVVWLRRGNCSVDETAAMLRDHVDGIRAFLDDARSAVLVIT